jgi:hypothetical protein
MLNALTAILRPFVHDFPLKEQKDYGRFYEVFRGALQIVDKEDYTSINYITECLQHRDLLVDFVRTYTEDFPYIALGDADNYEPNALFGKRVEHTEEKSIRKLLYGYGLITKLRRTYPEADLSLILEDESLLSTFPDLWLTPALFLLAEAVDLRGSRLNFVGIQREEPLYMESDWPHHSDVILVFRVIDGEDYDKPLPVELGVTFFYEDGQYGVFIADEFEDYEPSPEDLWVWKKAIAWFRAHNFFSQPLLENWAPE